MLMAECFLLHIPLNQPFIAFSLTIAPKIEISPLFSLNFLVNTKNIKNITIFLQIGDILSNAE